MEMTQIVLTDAGKGRAKAEQNVTGGAKVRTAALMSGAHGSIGIMPVATRNSKQTVGELSAEER
jgi:hypothetical protein